MKYSSSFLFCVLLTCGSSLADDSAKARLQHYIAARQQISFGQSSEADSTTYASGSSTAHQLHIQPLCLTGSPTASSSPGIATSGDPCVSAAYGSSPSGLSGAAAHAHFFLPGFRAGLEPGQGQEGRGQLGGALGSKQLSKLSSMQGVLPPDVAQLLEGALAARARLEPYRQLTDKENSACLAFDDMTMGRPESSSLPGAASGLTETVSGSEESDAAELPAELSHGHAELHSNVAPPSVGSNRVKVAPGLEGMRYGKTDSGTQARSAARRVKLHAMLENL